MARAAARPLVDTFPVTDFGGVEDTAAFKVDAQFDYSYTPGFSDLRRQQDLQKAEAVAGLRSRRDVMTLPVNLRWVRRGGQHEKTTQAANRGYQAVTKDDLAGNHPWLTALPPGAQIAPDGAVISAGGDLVLMKATAEVAARNALMKQQATNAMLNAAIDSDLRSTGDTKQDGLMSVGKRTAGVNPTITKTK